MRGKSRHRLDGRNLRRKYVAKTTADDLRDSTYQIDQEELSMPRTLALVQKPASALKYRYFISVQYSNPMKASFLGLFWTNFEKKNLM